MGGNKRGSGVFVTIFSRFFPLWVLSLLLVGGFPFASCAAIGDIFPPKDGVAVPVPGFPGFKIERRGKEVFMTEDGKVRPVGTLGENADEFDGTWPPVLAFDLDFDKIPEFMLLKKADENDSLYLLVHFKHGQNGANYRFSDHVYHLFANPAFDPEKRILVSRTSAGYSIAYVYKPPTRKNYPQYRWTEFDFHPARPSLQPSAGSAYFKEATDGKGIFVRLGVYPLLQKDIPLSFMPGALSLETYPKGNAVSISRMSSDGEWVYLSGLHDHAPRGWALAGAVLASVTEATKLLETTPEAVGADGCAPDLAAGSLVLVLESRKDPDKTPWMRIRNKCGLTGWVEERFIRSGE